MAKLVCPRCEEPSLDVRERDGVEIDVCTRCRGIWLDRGELDKLLAAASGSTAERFDGDGDDDDHHDHRGPRDDDDHGRRGPALDPRTGRPRRRGFLETLGDFFD